MATFGQIPSNVDFTAIILPYGGDTAPTGWLLCDGTAVSRTTFDDLFAIIGTKYGAGDGSTTFNLPDLKGRLPVGLDAGITDFDDRGKTGGAKDVTLTEAEMPSHAHAQIHRSGGSAGDVYPTWTGKIAGSTTQFGSSITGGAGSGSAHENMPPFVVVQYIIKT